MSVRVVLEQECDQPRQSVDSMEHLGRSAGLVLAVHVDGQGDAVAVEGRGYFLALEDSLLLKTVDERHKGGLDRQRRCEQADPFEEVDAQSSSEIRVDALAARRTLSADDLGRPIATVATLGGFGRILSLVLQVLEQMFDPDQ